MSAPAETPPSDNGAMVDFSSYELPPSRADPSALFSCHSNLIGSTASFSVFTDRLEVLEQDHEIATSLGRSQIVEWSVEMSGAVTSVVITTDHSMSWTIPIEHARPLRSALTALLEHSAPAA